MNENHTVVIARARIAVFVVVSIDLQFYHRFLRRRNNLLLLFQRCHVRHAARRLRLATDAQCGFAFLQQSLRVRVETSFSSIINFKSTFAHLTEKVLGFHCELFDLLPRLGQRNVAIAKPVENAAKVSAVSIDQHPSCSFFYEIRAKNGSDRQYQCSPSASVSTSILPENMARSIVSLPQSVPMVVVKKWPPTLSLTYCAGGPCSKIFSIAGVVSCTRFCSSSLDIFVCCWHRGQLGGLLEEEFGCFSQCHCFRVRRDRMRYRKTADATSVESL